MRVLLVYWSDQGRPVSRYLVNPFRNDLLTLILILQTF